MIKVIRKKGMKVNFNLDSMKKPMLTKKEKEIFGRQEEIDKRLEGLEKAEQIILRIQAEINQKQKELDEREEVIEGREGELNGMSDVWGKFNNLNLGELNAEEIMKIVNNQEGFVKDLLEHYVNSGDRIKELEKKNKSLVKEIDEVLDELGRIEVSEGNVKE